MTTTWNVSWACSADSMHLVIDGNNLMYKMGTMSGLGAVSRPRQALTHAVNLYRKLKSHRVTVVFDGGPSERGTRATSHGVPVIYSGKNRTADDVIAEMAQRHGPGITVITDDRELGERCTRCGSEIIFSHTFAGYLEQAVMYGDMDMAFDDEQEPGWDFTTRKKGPSKRLPKAKRRKQNKMRKL